MDKIDSFRKEYFFLSNFYPVSVTYDGLKYLSSEAAFQAQKCKNPEDRKDFTTLTPDESKKMGRHIQLRDDWEDVKFKVMKEIVFAKFFQNPELGKKLLNTGKAYLEEGNTWGDRIWGTVNGVGENNLGRILMEVREELIDEV